MLQGIQTQLLASGGEIIADGASIIFDTVVVDEADNISYNAATGEFTITAAGNYYVSWWVTTDGSDGPVNLAFAVVVDGGASIIGNAPLVTGQINGQAFLAITAVPATIHLDNVTGASIALASTVVQASMVIMQVAP